VNEYGLRILAESPAYLSKRVARVRKSNPDTPARKLAETVVGELNEGQRWALAVAAVEVDVTVFDRAQVRKVEKASTYRRATPAPRDMPTRRPSTERTPDPAALAALRVEISELRALAEREALSQIVELSPALLNSPVKLGDGAEVLIGDATVEEHAARIAMLEGHTQGNMDTLVRAIAWLNLLRDSGKSTLREVAS